MTRARVPLSRGGAATGAVAAVATSGVAASLAGAARVMPEPEASHASATETLATTTDTLTCIPAPPVVTDPDRRNRPSSGEAQRPGELPHHRRGEGAGEAGRSAGS